MLELLVVEDDVNRRQLRSRISVNAARVREYHYKTFIKKLYTESEPLRENEYILIAIEESRTVDKIVNVICEHNISLDRVLLYSDFKRIRIEEMQGMEDFVHGKDSYETVVFGMSHAKDGIFAECFDESLIKLAIPSIDLYYIKKMVEVLLERRKLNECKKVIFELPYYIFNWDVSKSSKVLEKIQIPYYFNDFHNYDLDGENRDAVDKIFIMNSIMKKKILVYKEETKQNISGIYSIAAEKRLKKNKLLKCVKSFCEDVLNETEESKGQKARLCKREANIWKKIHSKTIRENRKVWEDIIRLVMESCPSIQVFVVVFPHNPCFIQVHSSEIKRMRHIFYQNVNVDERLTILDDFRGRINWPSWFKDECHLNEFGGYMYSMWLNRALKHK